MSFFENFTSSLIGTLTGFSHRFQLSNSGVQVVLGASLGDSGLDFPIDPVDHVFGHGLSFGVVNSNLVVQSFFDGVDQIGLSVEVFGFEGQSQVVFPLFLDEGQTGSLFLQSFNTVDFGFDEGDFVIFPASDLAVSVLKLNSIFSVNEWAGHVWNKLITDKKSHTHSHAGFWSEDDPFFGDTGHKTTPEEHVWSAVAGFSAVLGEITFWQKGHSSAAFIVGFSWWWWEWTGISVWSTWHFKIFPVVQSVSLGGEGVTSLGERVSDSPGQHV